MRWTEGNLWTVTTPIHADDTYEYKYVIIDDNSPDPMANVQWQMGNNRTLALQLSLHDEVVLVEVVDSWSPDPKSMPILLHELDGTIKEVGSTKLLRDASRNSAPNKPSSTDRRTSSCSRRSPRASEECSPRPETTTARARSTRTPTSTPPRRTRPAARKRRRRTRGSDASSSAPSSSSSVAGDARDENDATGEFEPNGDVTVMSDTSASTVMNNTVALNMDISSSSAEAGEAQDAEVGPR